mmetsp:Transcript_14309/g.42699  ORF Transcript_14309/g.42699 Transcript_14309/m.42699 type:complete len:164 (-) Transcript_14309:38-529(-)
MRALVAVLAVVASARRPKVGEDGQVKRLYESMFARDWIFDQTFTGKGRARWRRSGPVRVTLDRERGARFRGAGRLRGIWNQKDGQQPSYLEMELPLNRDDSRYLLYKADCRPGGYFDNAIEFDEGTIYEVTSFVPMPETTREVGKFSVRPVTARPMLDRGLRC